MINILIIAKNKLSVQLPDLEVDYTDNIDTAISFVKTKFYDAVIVEFSINEYSGTQITQFFPHYRTILLISGEDEKTKLGNYRNGFFTVTSSTDNLEQYVNGITEKYPKKEEDSLIAIMNIHGTIKNLQKSYEFIKNNFSTIHNKLKKLEEAQLELNTNFEDFKTQKAKNEQFFIDTIIDIKASLK